MNKQKKSIQIAVVLVVLTGLLGVYFFRNNKVKTENKSLIVTKDVWGIYQNTKLGFSVEVPSRWKVSEYGGLVSFIDEDDSPALSFNVSLFPFKDQSAQTYLNKLNENNNEIFNIISTKKVKVSGIDAVYRERIDLDGSNNLSTYIPMNNKVYVLDFEQGIKLTQSNRDLFDQIISTFKFVN